LLGVAWLSAIGVVADLALSASVSSSGTLSATADTGPTCGATIQTAVTLTSDLSGCTGNGLRVRTGGSLDCNGHAITGTGTAYGVLVDTATGAQVLNCRISQFSRGIRIAAGASNTASGNELFDNNNYGLELAGATTGNQIESNLVHDNHDEGIHVGTGASNNVIADNQILRSAVENLYLLSSSGNTVERNTIAGSQSAAMYIKHTTSSTFTDNLVSDGPVLVRGSSSGNLFTGNQLTQPGYGFRFKAYNDTVLGWTFPHDNTVVGGSIPNARVCFSFAGAYDNQATQITAGRCTAATRTTLGRQKSTNDVVELIRSS